VRLFLSQTNVVETSEITNKIDGSVADDLTIVVKVFDSTDTVVPDSTVTLSHVGEGKYRNKIPKLEELIDNDRYKLEMKITREGEDIWYFKGLIRAIIRNTT
jgi:hypothetical protein